MLTPIYLSSSLLSSRCGHVWRSRHPEQQRRHHGRSSLGEDGLGQSGTESSFFSSSLHDEIPELQPPLFPSIGSAAWGMGGRGALPSHLTQPSVLQVGTIRGCYLALEHMSKLSGGRGGVIVNTASMAGEAGKSGTCCRPVMLFTLFIKSSTVLFLHREVCCSV